jgi:DNA primase
MYLDKFAERANRMLFEYPEAKSYLNGRGFDDDDIRRFGFGYLKIAKIHKENSEDYRRFHRATYQFKNLQARIIIPLHNIVGHVNGLTVRSIEEKLYKDYLLEEARNIGAFFGLHDAIPHIIKTGRVFVHEGAFDAASFAKVFPNSVSTLTSFISDEQYETLRMFADKIFLVFDDDKTGHTGQWALVKRYGRKYIDAVSIGADDSNACLKRRGPKGFESYLKKRIPLLLQQ